MKKGLLLSVVASGLIYAGGDIAPVAPVAPQAAPAACDFYGSIGARYDANKFEVDGTTIVNGDFGDKESNTFFTALDLGVDTQLGYGFGIGAELGAVKSWHKIASAPGFTERASLSQLYLTYKAGNTAIKVGRQALPKSLSPMAWSDSTVGVKNQTFEGVVVVNTDITDTTLVGAWVHKIVPFGTAGVKLNKDTGVFMLAAQYTGIANTTLTGSVYYGPKTTGGLPGDLVSAWGSVESKLNGINVGLQGVYSNLDVTGLDKTLAVAAYAGGQWDAVDAKLTVAYINDGDSPINPMGSVYGSGTSGFWGNVGYSSFGGEALGGLSQTIVKLDAGYKLPNNYGKIFAGVAYDKPDTNPTVDNMTAARVGYSFKVKGVNAKVEYRYTKISGKGANPDVTGQKIRVEGIYKF